MKTAIPPTEFPAVVAAIAMLQAYLSGDFPRYERQKNVLLAFIADMDDMIDSARR